MHSVILRLYDHGRYRFDPLPAVALPTHIAANQVRPPAAQLGVEPGTTVQAVVRDETGAEIDWALVSAVAADPNVTLPAATPMHRADIVDWIDPTAATPLGGVLTAPSVTLSIGELTPGGVPGVAGVITGVRFSHTATCLGCGTCTAVYTDGGEIRAGLQLCDRRTARWYYREHVQAEPLLPDTCLNPACGRTDWPFRGSEVLVGIAGAATRELINDIWSAARVKHPEQAALADQHAAR